MADTAPMAVACAEAVGGAVGVGVVSGGDTAPVAVVVMCGAEAVAELVEKW